MYVFLATNGFTIETSENEVVKVMLGVAEGSIQEPELAIWLEMNSIPNSPT
jgi:death-on-curing protein